MIDVVSAQSVLQSAELATPQDIGMGPHHAFGARRRAGGEEHQGVGGRVGCLGWCGRVHQGGEALRLRRPACTGRRFARIRLGNRDPFEVRTMLGEQSRKFRLRDRSAHAGGLDHIAQFRPGQSGIAQHGNGADPHAGETGYQCFRTVLEMNEDAIFRSNATFQKAAGDAGHIMRELRIAPCPHRCVEGCPDQQRVRTTGRGAGAQQFSSILAAERMDERQSLVGGHGRLSLGASILFLLHSASCRGYAGKISSSRSAGRQTRAPLAVTTTGRSIRIGWAPSASRS